MEEQKNPKAAAWDLIGGLYWSAGYQGGPIGEDIDAYLAGVSHGATVAVIGASTKLLIEEALRRGARVTVLDFSERMCEALSSAVDLTRCQIELHDILLPVADKFRENYNFVIADRLINRFTEREVRQALSGMLQLTGDNGEIRTGVRLGLYKRDLPLIDEGRRSGTLAEFFNEDTWTIDYGRAHGILEKVLAPHGSIPHDILLDFYRLRGPEKRYRHQDIEDYVRDTRCDNRSMVIHRVVPMPVSKDDTLYTMRPER